MYDLYIYTVYWFAYLFPGSFVDVFLFLDLLFIDLLDV